MKKPDDVKIISMSTSLHHDNSHSMFGLGDDQKVYTWSYADGCWYGQWKTEVTQ